jgi:hypothetical protein
VILDLCENNFLRQFLERIGIRPITTPLDPKHLEYGRYLYRSGRIHEFPEDCP